MQGGYLSLLYSTSAKPLEYWSKQKSKTGSIVRVFDKELNDRVLEIQDVDEANGQRTWIMCPPDIEQILNVKLPVLVMVIKCLQAHLLIQLQIVDKDNVRHLINLSNVEAKRKSGDSKVAPIRIHLKLEPGWNRLEIDFAVLGKSLGVQFVAVSRIRVYPNCRIRRLYFLDKHYKDYELSNALYQGFFDFYMSKWSIKSVERTTQTKRTLGKPGKETFIFPVNSFNKLFLKNLQSKSDRMIDDHLSKHPLITVKEYLEFKRKAKIKPYVIPDRNKFKVKRDSESNLDLSEIRKYFIRDNNLHERLTFEEKTAKKPKIVEPEKPVSNQDITNLMYKVYRYRYPTLPDKHVSETKKELPKKYTVVKRNG